MDRKVGGRLEDYIENSIVLKTKGNIYIFKPNEIVFLSSKGNYITIHTTSHEPITVPYNLKKVQEKYFSKFPFIRTHQSHIINVEHLSTYSISDENKKYVVMDNNHELPLST